MTNTSVILDPNLAVETTQSNHSQHSAPSGQGSTLSQNVGAQQKELHNVPPIPAGDYLVTISSAHLKDQANGAYKLVILNMIISAGDFNGSTLSKFYHLKSQKSVDFFKKELLQLGFVIKGPHELKSLCDNMANTCAMATVCFNDSGNRIIFLKAAAAPKKIEPIKAEFNW